MTKTLSIVVAIPAGFLLYYGAVFLFMVPGDRGEPYLSKGRLIYGCTPFVGGVLLTLLVVLLWKRR